MLPTSATEHLIVLVLIALLLAILSPLKSLNSLISLLLHARKPFRRRAKHDAVPPLVHQVRVAEPEPLRRRNAPKPQWVRTEVIRLALFLGGQGCRKIADVFNAIYLAHEDPAKRERVGKTFVARLVMQNQLEILRLKQSMKHHVPGPLANNVVWGLDMTFAPERYGHGAILGIIDHGSRRCLVLVALSSRKASVILRYILEAIREFGRPKAIRTNNDGPFKSKLFRRLLRFIGVRHLKNRPMSPWENGRIERFFGTLKPFLLDWLKSSTNAFQADLNIFRTWYNNVRTHHHLGGRTPAMAWAGRVNFKPPIRIFNEWERRLTGYVFPT